jgi:hypothetical protein
MPTEDPLHSRPDNADFVLVARELNRFLFERNGDALAVMLADYIRDRKIAISEPAVHFLLDAVRAVRQR